MNSTSYRFSACPARRDSQPVHTVSVVQADPEFAGVENAEVEILYFRRSFHVAGPMDGYTAQARSASACRRVYISEVELKEGTCLAAAEVSTA